MMFCSHVKLALVALLASVLRKVAFAMEEEDVGPNVHQFMALVKKHSTYDGSQGTRHLQEIGASVEEIFSYLDAEIADIGFGPFFTAFNAAAALRPGNDVLNRNDFEDMMEAPPFNFPQDLARDWRNTLYVDGTPPPIAALNFGEFLDKVAELKGDPHVVMWNGDRYDFHGECDLVAVSSKQFSNNLGLDLHMRTSKLGDYSYTESVAIKIGNTVLEVNGENPEEKDLQIFLNGKKIENEQLPLSLPEGNLVLYGVDSELANNRQDVFRLKSEDVEVAFWVTVKKYLSIDISGSGSNFADARGLMGTFSKSSKPLSRSDVLMVANSEENQAATDLFGLEWQVKNDDPRIFRTSRAPQWPQVCNMPSVEQRSRRLRAADPKLVALAESACAGKQNRYDIADCKVDVMATGEASMADLYN